MFAAKRLIAGSSLSKGLCVAALLAGQLVAHAADDPQVIAMQLGDYRFTPQELAVPAGHTLRLELTNTDGITPHNFTLKDPAAGLDIDTDVPPGATRVVELTPKQPGSYAFYCNKKLPFMKSHRERGMQGTLTVLPAD
jgi:uncharacterized cupredoxin-like copper-binding protein